MEELSESNKKIGGLIEKSQLENVLQTAIEHTQCHQRIEINKGVIYGTELENKLKKMKNKTRFFWSKWRPGTWLDMERLSYENIRWDRSGNQR